MSQALRLWRIFLMVPLVGLFFGFSISFAQAATINVNYHLDIVDGFDGFCTLREAITSANNNAPVGVMPGECAGGSGLSDTITIPSATFTMSIAGTDDANLGGDFDVLSNVVLQGTSSTTAIIDGNNLDRVFHVLNGASVTMNDLSITHGTALMNGGGILLENSTFLNLTNVVLSNNSAENGAALYVTWMPSGFGTVALNNVQALYNTAIQEGGAIYNQGYVTLSNSVLDSNTATRGGAVYSDGNFTSVNSIVSNNSAIQDGGGLFVDAFDPVANSSSLIRTTVKNNTAGVSGGGVYHAFGMFTLNSSTVSGNTANTTNTVNNPPVTGGGISNLSGNMDLINSTLSGNTIASGNGGGFANFNGTVRFMNTTVTANLADDGGGIYEYYGFAYISLMNSIIAKNSSLSAQSNDIMGDVASSGNNLVFNSLGSVGLQPSDIVGQDPKLAALALNAPGVTETHALLSNSPAIDTATDSVCTNSLTVNGLDQRGVQRPFGPHCDIGSYEYNVPMNVDLTILKNDGLTNVSIGQVVTYTIRVKNVGNTYVVNGIQVVDALPVNLINASWSCAITTGIGSCSQPGPVNGSINTMISLNPNAIATFTLTATVLNTGLNSVTNTATVSVPSGYLDTNPLNNSSTDLDRIRT